jgi:hypothetical protein
VGSIFVKQLSNDLNAMHDHNIHRNGLPEGSVILGYGGTFDPALYMEESRIKKNSFQGYWLAPSFFLQRWAIGVNLSADKEWALYATDPEHLALGFWVPQHLNKVSKQITSEKKVVKQINPFQNW